MFQSTPRFVGEGNLSSVIGLIPSSGFNPPPALSARGTPDAVQVALPPLFQSTPRFVGEGNLGRLVRL